MKYKVTLFRLGQVDVEAESPQDAEYKAQSISDDYIHWISRDGKRNMVSLVEAVNGD